MKRIDSSFVEEHCVATDSPTDPFRFDQQAGQTELLTTLIEIRTLVLDGRFGDRDRAVEPGGASAVSA
jgi:hypothetical protein